MGKKPMTLEQRFWQQVYRKHVRREEELHARRVWQEQKRLGPYMGRDSLDFE